jgi:hypothetical protein
MNNLIGCSFYWPTKTHVKYGQCIIWAHIICDRLNLWFMIWRNLILQDKNSKTFIALILHYGTANRRSRCIICTVIRNRKWGGGGGIGGQKWRRSAHKQWWIVNRDKYTDMQLMSSRWIAVCYISPNVEKTDFILSASSLNKHVSAMN